MIQTTALGVRSARHDGRGRVSVTSREDLPQAHQAPATNALRDLVLPSDGARQQVTEAWAERSSGE
jgi:hypothetical protein